MIQAVAEDKERGALGTELASISSTQSISFRGSAAVAWKGY